MKSKSYGLLETKNIGSTIILQPPKIWLVVALLLSAQCVGNNIDWVDPLFNLLQKCVQLQNWNWRWFQDISGFAQLQFLNVSKKIWALVPRVSVKRPIIHYCLCEDIKPDDAEKN